MPTLTVKLPAKLKAFVEEQGNASTFIAKVVKAEQRRRAEARLLALVEEAEASGPARIMTDADWQRLDQELLEREARRKKGMKSNGRQTRSPRSRRARSS